MGLEKLKSIFSTKAGNSTSIKGGRHGGTRQGGFPEHSGKHSELDNLKNVNFLDSPIRGFTDHFNTMDKSELAPINNVDGYIQPQKMIDILGGIAPQFDSVATNTSILNAPFKLGFDNSANGGLDLSGYANGQVGDVNPTNESFNFGIQFTNSLTPSNITVSGLNDGALGLLEWFNISGDRFSIDHASGQMSFNFSGTPTPTPYEETIWELGTPNGTLISKGSLSNENALDFNVPYRGNIFQVRDEENLDQLKRTVFVKNRIPVGALQDPISGWINEFLGTVNLSGGYDLGDFFNISTPSGFSITGDLSDISLNYRPRLTFNADAFFSSIRESFERKTKETSGQLMDRWKESFTSRIGDSFNNISSGLSDIADSVGFSQTSVFSEDGVFGGFGETFNLGNYISGLQSSLLSGDEIGKQTYQQLRKSLTDVNYPGFGGSAAKNIRGIQGPRGLSNPEATQYKAGEPIRSQTSPGKDAQDPNIVQSPSAGPYSKLIQAVDRIDEFQYSPKGYEKNFTRGSLNPDNLENFGEGDKKGDYMTLNPISNELFPEKDNGKIVKGQKGMQFWFKDKRNFKFVTFRAYLEAITENVAPSWSSENYIGKSEPVFLYERAERDISFQLKLYAGTEDELDAIYNKINALTSFCYPEYQADSKFSVGNYPNGKLRMKPPLLEMRMGNLYGNMAGGVQGFIKSLTYSVPDNSDWEVSAGRIVPKLFTVSITYQIIHSTSPNINTQFYGLGKYQKT